VHRIWFSRPTHQGGASAPRGAAILVAVLMALAAGCASTEWVSLRATPKNPLADQLKLFAKGGPRPTERTRLLLRRYALEDEWKGDPCQLCSHLREITEREPTADKVYALAELAYLGGKQHEATDPKKALELFGVAALYSYLYLFDDYYGRTRNPYDPEFRGACDLYNGSLESALRIVKHGGALAINTTRTLPLATGQLQLTVVSRVAGWRAEDIERLEFASDYEVTGLLSQYRTAGLGVPLIAVRKPCPQPPSGAERYYPPGLCFPVTAFLRVTPDPAGRNGQHAAVLELFDPLVSCDILLSGRRVPLETDLSTPLAYLLNNPALRALDELATVGLLRPEKSSQAKGLYMLEPYDPGKIPVLMVHGLWSTPITWMEMFNDLRSTAEIRSRYQFWFYLYPTGQPFWYSAAALRQDLATLRETLDPARRHAALDQMVLVGHSMGGLVSMLQAVESGNSFWQLVSDQPFANVRGQPQVRQTLASTFFFEPNPAVRRVITIGTPHRGSHFANDTTRYLGSKLIRLPKMLMSTRRQLERDNPGLVRDGELIDVATSIDSLSPSSKFLPVLLAAPRPQGVRYHNIVGRVEDEGFVARLLGGSDEQGGDGVVPVSSARLDNVDSELVVPADHSLVHRHPRSVLEVRRILLQHAAETAGPRLHSPLEAPPWTAQREPAAAGSARVSSPPRLPAASPR
jgi:pimeloyl-ACP methyl ester carboxylesterase